MSQTSAATQMQDDLRAFRDQVKSTQVLAGFLGFLSIVAGVVLAFSFLAGANVLTFLRDQWARWTVLTALVTGGAASFLCLVLKPLLWRPTYDVLARLVEERIAGLDNAYINAVQLARERHSPSGSLIARAIDECLGRARRFDISAAVERRGFRIRAWTAGAIATLLFAYMIGSPGRFAAGASMLFNPKSFVPSVGAAAIDYVKPGSVDVIRGQEITVEVGIKAALKAIPSRSVHVVLAGGREVDKELLAVSPTQFRASLGPAQLPFDYMVEVGGTQSEWYRVRVSERPSVKSITLRYQYPRYTGMSQEVVSDSSGDVSGPYGTTVAVEVEATRPIASGYLQLDDGRAELLPAEAENARAATFMLRRDGLYRIALTDADGNVSDSSVPHPIRVTLDQPPVVTMPLPARDITVTPGAYVPVLVEVSDDYGIDFAELVMAEADNPAAEKAASRWNTIIVRGVSLAYTLYVDPKAFAAGKAYAFYARAADGNTLTGPGEGRSQKYVMRVVDPAEAQAQLVKDLQSWYDRLRKVLDMQQSAREEIRGVDPAADKSPAILARVGEEQTAIRAETTAIAADMSSAALSIATARRVLEGLIASDMTSAIDDCAEIPKMRPMSAMDLDALGQTQDRIAESLKRLLGLIGNLLEGAGSGKLAEGNAVDSDAQQKLSKLLDELRKFTEEQKRVIEATNNLAAVPVDDYTDDMKSKIKELQTAEDNWSKFLKEAYSDLSKLPDQDFTNPSVLKDIVETYSEVEMAADALAKEPVTIAVPHEQAGLELAEQLTTHIEKWLMDIPDRLKWEMEEPITDVDVPMAELPTTLQDIVGDLMEQEEDLFTDIEDVSSSWADSLDKGAGWDTMDGPISNMSAQGVTGNALPNNTEIGGRSAEGRTGKSSGEFVGDSAVGKGGRRTPTRITPDPFAAGDIKDTSEDGAGGATGGGKESGAGEQGLQGPVPRELAKAIARLEGRQSQIISKAQRLNIAMKLASYPNADMDVALQEMKGAEGELRNGHLANALRRRAVLVKSLKGASGVVGNDLVVNKDNSLVLPKGLQEEIMDGAQGRAPRGYDRLLKGYYESLSSSK